MSEQQVKLHPPTVNPCHFTAKKLRYPEEKQVLLVGKGVPIAANQYRFLTVPPPF